MRFLSFVHKGQVGFGLLDEDAVCDLSQIDSNSPTLKEFIANNGLTRLSSFILSSAPRYPLSDIQYLPPIPNPNKILCLGLNYKDHAAEGGFDLPEHPTFFTRFATTLTGHHQPIIRPKASHRLDYEAELAVIIGETCRHLTPLNALQAVWGYSIFNDASVRDYQVRSSQWTLGKNFDSTGGFGPYIVTPDELPEGAFGLGIRTRLNGELLQNDTTENMIFDVTTTLCALTECLTLEAGDIVIMGTPSGVGFARQPRIWMKPGDCCEVEIDQIGTLINPIEAEV